LRITILNNTNSTFEFQELEQRLRAGGYALDFHSLVDKLPENQDIVSILDLSQPFFHEINPEDFANFQRISSELGTRKMLWLTRASQIDCQDPRYSMVLGLARVLRAEAQTDFTTLELDNLTSNEWDVVLSVLGKIKSRDFGPGASRFDPDYEYIVSEGNVLVGRYQSITIPREIPVLPSEVAPKKLHIGKLGLLQSLRWEQQAPLEALGSLELEIEPHVVGLNFRVSILHTMPIAWL
jgi:hypothetical protein